MFGSSSSHQRGSTPGAADVASRRPAAAIAVAIASTILAACGGGGGGAANASAQGGGSEGSGGGTNPPPVTTPAPLTTNRDAFYFKADASLAQAGALDQFGGSFVSGWDVYDPSKMMQPGLKIVFYGTAAGCPYTTRNGPVSAGMADQKAAALSRSGLAAASDALAWTPTAGAAGCDAPVGNTSGGAYAAIDASDSSGGLAIYTPNGPDASGNPQFFRAWGAEGQNGQGANAYIAGTFINFRQNWNTTDPRQPWAGKGDGSTTDARLRSTQRVLTAAVGVDEGAATPVQVKQQMMVTFVNTACAAEGNNSAQHPCQVNYLVNTDIVRTGVTDWSTQSWYADAKVTFDPVQGGLPVVTGPIKAQGTSTNDSDSGLPLFTSQGAATQHGAFGDTVFDIRISFAQLQNVLRIVTARLDNVSPSAVTDAQLAATWSARFADPTAWATVSTMVAQENFNPLSDHHPAEIGGVVRDLYVGPQY